MMPDRRWYSQAQLTTLWGCWYAGQTLEAIAQTLAVSTDGVARVVTAAGGIRPPTPTRNARTLSRPERDIIERGLAAGLSIRSLARTLARAPSTICREIHRNGARTSAHRGYHASTADARAWRAAKRPKVGRLATHPALRAAVTRQLLLQWSPAQIAAWLRVTYPEDPTMQVSAETIYQSLYVQARGLLRKELTTHLRRGQQLRRPQRVRSRVRPPAIVEAISIRERPPDVADRAVPGHWEGDLIAGAQSSYIATLVERTTRYVMLVKVSTKESGLVARALARRIRHLPDDLRASLTWDRGTELAQHQALTLATHMQIYFCDPRSPWQRGTNENTNGLLRQYFPRGMELSHFSQRHLNAVALRLNTRPRRTLGWQTPAARFAAYVAMTG